jgi:curved DNA-binding protein CbpA
MAELEKNFYDILGLTPKATTREVADAYRNLVLSHHPDRFTEASEKFEAEEVLKAVTEAYNTLSRPALRAQYDKDHLGGSSPEQAKKSPQEQARDFFQQAMTRVQTDPTGALSLFDYVIRLTPDDAQALFHAGMIRLRSPKWRVQGAQQVEAAITKDPFNARYVVEYARFLMGSGQTLRAERILSQALQYHTNDPSVTDLLAACGGEDKNTQGFGLFGKKK